jgi:hypothetical protein
MRVRLIFRGLTIFSFKNAPDLSTKGLRSEEGPKLPNLGEMTAWLVSDPRHAKEPLHSHKPLWGFIGRDYGMRAGAGSAGVNLQLPPLTTVALVGHTPPDGEPGIRVHGSFLDYVPLFDDLLPGRTPADILNRLHDPANAFVTRRIVIPTGTVRSREFVKWDWYGNTPARVGFMDTMIQGFLSNEIVVDIGDDSDLDDHKDDKFLQMSGKGLDKKLWARSKKADDDDIDPNVVEVLFSNLPAKRSRPVPWGLHAFTAFEAAGFERRLAPTYADQYEAFLNVTKEYDPIQWAFDSDMMGKGLPFPFLIDPRREKLDALAPAKERPMPVVPPDPAGRKKGEGPRPGNGHGSHGTSHDPDNREICPNLRV